MKPHHVHPASVRGPWSRHHLEIATAPAAPAGSTRPGAQPSARRPPAARGDSVLAGPRGARCPPARTHALGPGTGKSGGGPSTLATLPRSRSRTPRRIASTPPQSGPMVCYSRRPLPTGWGPYRTTQSMPTPGSPNIVCSGTMHACENGGPPPLPFRDGRKRFGRGGETPSPLPFSRALGCVPRPAPRVAAAYVCAGRRALPCLARGSRSCMLARGPPAVPRAGLRTCKLAGGHACWPEGPRLHPGPGLRTCALASGPAPGTGAGLVCTLAPTWLHQPHASRQSVLPF